MRKNPKHDQQSCIDDWICCWCGAINKKTLTLQIHDGSDMANCEKCGGLNLISFSVEYTTYPRTDDGEVPPDAR